MSSLPRTGQVIKALTKRAETGRGNMGGAGSSCHNESFIPYRCVYVYDPINAVVKNGCVRDHRGKIINENMDMD